ncbi:MAG: NUDIX domain-containing protein [Planctomycetota bacterium]
MDFDPDRPPAPPREAATVILLRARKGDGAAEVLLLRRGGGAPFMARSFVYPGGARDGDEDLRATSARELFEEAGVLLADRALDAARLAEWRARQAAGEALAALLAEAEASLALDRLLPFAHWITPSAERRRFSAHFFVGLLPPGQEASPDDAEMTEQRWLTPSDALAQADALELPPPQLRTLRELEPAARRGPDAVLELARARAPHLRPIVPRFAKVPAAPEGFALLLPWDHEYETLGTGAGDPFPQDHPLAGGASRFIRDPAGWRHV